MDNKEKMGMCWFIRVFAVVVFLTLTSESKDTTTAPVTERPIIVNTTPTDWETTEALEEDGSGTGADDDKFLEFNETMGEELLNKSNQRNLTEPQDGASDKGPEVKYPDDPDQYTTAAPSVENQQYSRSAVREKSGGQNQTKGARQNEARGARFPKTAERELRQRFGDNLFDAIKAFRRTWKKNKDEPQFMATDDKDAGSVLGWGKNKKPKKDLDDISADDIEPNTWGPGGERILTSLLDKTMKPPTLRKEYRQLTDEERRKFHLALWALKLDMIGEVSAYDLFVFFHQDEISPAAHFGLGFLPWHREFLLRFERALQKFQPDTAVPYWDSTLDYTLPNPRDSILWDDEFMGTADGEVKIDGWMWPVHKICQQNDSAHLLRWNTGWNGSALFTDYDINQVMKMNSFTELNIPALLEHEHGGAHVFLGGQMMDLPCSPADPLFFMHHAFVDFIWEEVSRKPNYTNTYPYESTRNDVGGPQHNPRSIMKPFLPLENVNGLIKTYTDKFYHYNKRPYICSDADDCGLYLFCHGGRCKSKVRLGGDCRGLPPDKTPCYRGTCYQDRCQLL